jgi:TraM recognition site of TraD and TraG
MRQMPGRGDLPLYVLFDEFSHSTIPSFAAIANTIRAYKVSLSVVLQSVAELSARYGRDMSHAIQGGSRSRDLHVLREAVRQRQGAPAPRPDETEPAGQLSRVQPRQRR